LYEDLGMLPLKPVKALLHSSFKAAYEAELTNNYVDNLNLMYVAMTRAEQQLYIYSEHSDNDEIKNAANIVKTVVSKSTILTKIISDNSEQAFATAYEAGSPKEVRSATVISNTKALESYIINRWQEKISISSKAGDLRQLVQKGRKEKIDFGILMHRLLSEVKTQGQALKAIEKMILEGIITSEEKLQLIQETAKYFSIEGIELFYNANWTVMTEREIIQPEGEILRPDRVLINGNKAMVVDFKTGIEKVSHSRQVKKYAEALTTMGYEDVSSYLIYLNEQKIVALEKAEHSV
jgi:ATP-dependent helicase/nuclease subunit A